MILPPDVAPPERRWGPDEDKLHRHLLHCPALLPRGANLLVAISGGQDSMALVGLLRDLQSRHSWQLTLWHGDHGWRREAAAQAEALAAWSHGQGLLLHCQRADPPPASEAAARHWRYGCLVQQANTLGCDRVLTAHTATDRAETLLLNLARGSHLRGLAALRAERPLANGLKLVRPLLSFTREDTARICRQKRLPIWLDPTNTDPRFSRNRVRSEVIPVLDTLHPGATARIAALAERLAQEDDQAEELLALALRSLTVPAVQGQGVASLARRPLSALQPANQRRVLQHWFRRYCGRPLDARSLEQLLARLPPDQGPGRQDLPQGWHLRWDGSSLYLIPPADPTPHGDLN